MRYFRKIFTTISAVILTGLILQIPLFNSCKKFEVEHELIVHTDTISIILSNFVHVKGTIVDFRGDGVQDHGFVCSFEQNPTIEDSIRTSNGPIKTAGRFENGWYGGIRANNTYYVRAYAMDDLGIAYGRELSFTTPDPVLPQITTMAISSVTDTSAQSGGIDIDDGGADITAKGICWSMDPSPIVSGEHSDVGGGAEDFTSTFDSLTCNTTYYVRAYAINSVGTGYGEELSFTTNQCLLSMPTVSTTAISSITETSAQGGGNVSDDGGSPVTARGICWSTSSNPTTSDNLTADGTGTGSFTSELTGLDPETTYYLRAYATNNEGTAYGEEKEFTTLELGNTVTDYDGNEYQVVMIGFQNWMAENLKVTHYADGTPIPFVEDQAAWGNMGPADKAYCYYDNNTTHAETYGALYTWAAAMNGDTSSYLNPSGVQGVCPSGWHLPSDIEWKQLEMYLGMSQEDADLDSWRGTDEGGKLKETDTIHWNDPNTGANNSSGFTAMPGGDRHDKGNFINMHLSAVFWSSTEGISNHAWYRSLRSHKS
ncbi:MAG: hypothetical protein KAT15_11750, partial [Bacteroidales bacterium]|nr:hypothetical protein [Bacteroidales bacterium]